jgi:type 1 glutamine amidotransferase
MIRRKRQTMKTLFRSILLVTVLSTFAAGADPAPKPAMDPAPENAQRALDAKRILLITGEDYQRRKKSRIKGHVWQETAPALRDELQKDARLEVDILDDLKLLRSQDLSKYAAVVMHFKNYKPQVPGRAGYDNLASFVENGGGLVLVHFACGAFQEFKEDFEKVAGRVWNPTMRGHDRSGPFQVEVIKPDHPALAGLKSFETTDELYTCLDGDTPIDVLATAVSKVDGKTYPMVFVLKYGKGRVFHCPLGHTVAALTNEPVAELFRRGTAWVAGTEAVEQKATVSRHQTDHGSTRSP